MRVLAVTQRDEAPPAEGEPIACEYCEERFARRDYLALHRGLEHPDALSDRERAEFERARESEREEIRLYRLKAIGLLVLLYFGLLLVYAVAT